LVSNVNCYQTRNFRVSFYLVPSEARPNFMENNRVGRANSQASVKEREDYVFDINDFSCTYRNRLHSAG